MGGEALVFESVPCPSVGEFQGRKAGGGRGGGHKGERKAEQQATPGPALRQTTLELSGRSREEDSPFLQRGDSPPKFEGRCQ